MCIYCSTFTSLERMKSFINRLKKQWNEPGSAAGFGRFSTSPDQNFSIPGISFSLHFGTHLSIPSTAADTYIPVRTGRRHHTSSAKRNTAYYQLPSSIQLNDHDVHMVLHPLIPQENSSGRIRRSHLLRTLHWHARNHCFCKKCIKEELRQVQAWMPNLQGSYSNI